MQCVPAGLLVRFDVHRFDEWNAGELSTKSAGELLFGNAPRFGFVSCLDGHRHLSLDSTTVRFQDRAHPERALFERVYPEHQIRLVQRHNYGPPHTVNVAISRW
jgi:hypothetical protein